MTPPLDEVIRSLRTYMRAEEFRGYDPFDGLLSPLARLPLLRRSRGYKLLLQQGVKRIPFNLRPLLGIRKGCNPVTLGLYLQGLAELAAAHPAEAGALRQDAAGIVERLRAMQSPGWSGACWGYDFDWQARYVFIPAFGPTIVATGIITNALAAAHEAWGIAEAGDMCRSAARFVLTDLHRTGEAEEFCFSYSPYDRQRVFNATLKGARLLAQAHRLGGEETLREACRATVRFATARQRPDGSWGYADGDARTWIDNFHTAYNLDCLHAVRGILGWSDLDPVIERGWAFYRKNFFTAEGAPRYYAHETWPLDATAAAQSILTLLRFGDPDAAARVAEWSVARLRHPAGWFLYQLRRNGPVRISFMRWSNAWMFAALAALSRRMAEQ